MNPRIYADFQNLDEANRLRLTCQGTAADLSRHGIELRDGKRLTFYMDDVGDDGRRDDLLVDGVVQYDAVQNCWVAAVDWTAVRHDSDERPQPIHGLPNSTDRATKR